MNGSWWIFVKQVLIEGYLIDLGDHSCLTYCKNHTQFAQVRGIFKSSISLNRDKTDQNGVFLSFWGSIAFKNLLIFVKGA